MQKIDYETALRALNEAVKDKGYNHVYERPGETGGCWNVTESGDADCIVGWSLLWLGVPADWFLQPDQYGSTDGRRGASAGVACQMLASTDVMSFTDEAAVLFRAAQVVQDGGGTWGEAVVRAHLGDDLYDEMHLGRDVVPQ